MSMKSLVGKRITKKVDFMGEKVDISKLSVAEVMSIQEKAKEVGEDDEKGFGILKHVITSAVEGAEDLSEEDFEKFPMEELSRLSNAIMNFSGMGADPKGK